MAIILFKQDVNDLPPKFAQESYEATIVEEDDKNLPKKILKVCATRASGEIRFLSTNFFSSSIFLTNFL